MDDGNSPIVSESLPTEFMKLRGDQNLIPHNAEESEPVVAPPSQSEDTTQIMEVDRVDLW